MHNAYDSHAMVRAVDPVATTSLDYDFLIGPGGTAADANEFYLNVYANFGVSDNDKFYDCRYNIVPTSGSTASFTTVSYDPTPGLPGHHEGRRVGVPVPLPGQPCRHGPAQPRLQRPRPGAERR